LGGARKKGRKEVAAHSGARLKLRRHRAGTKHGDAHASRFKLLMERFTEGDHISLAGVIDRHARAGQKAGGRGDIEYPAFSTFEAVDKSQREVGERAHIQVYHGELRCAIELVGRSEQPEAGT